MRHRLAPTSSAPVHTSVFDEPKWRVLCKSFSLAIPPNCNNESGSYLIVGKGGPYRRKSLASAIATVHWLRSQRRRNPWSFFKPINIKTIIVPAGIHNLSHEGMSFLQFNQKVEEDKDEIFDLGLYGYGLYYDEMTRCLCVDAGVNGKEYLQKEGHPLVIQGMGVGKTILMGYLRISGSHTTVTLEGISLMRSQKTKGLVIDNGATVHVLNSEIVGSVVCGSKYRRMGTLLFMKNSTIRNGNTVGLTIFSGSTVSATNLRVHDIQDVEETTGKGIIVEGTSTLVLHGERTEVFNNSVGIEVREPAIVRMCVPRDFPIAHGNSVANYQHMLSTQNNWHGATSITGMGMTMSYDPSGLTTAQRNAMADQSKSRLAQTECRLKTMLSNKGICIVPDDFLSLEEALSAGATEVHIRSNVELCIQEIHLHRYPACKKILGLVKQRAKQSRNDLPRLYGRFIAANLDDTFTLENLYLQNPSGTVDCWDDMSTVVISTRASMDINNCVLNGGSSSAIYTCQLHEPSQVLFPRSVINLNNCLISNNRGHGVLQVAHISTQLVEPFGIFDVTVRTLVEPFVFGVYDGSTNKANKDDLHSLVMEGHGSASLFLGKELSATWPPQHKGKLPALVRINDCQMYGNAIVSLVSDNMCHCGTRSCSTLLMDQTPRSEQSLRVKKKKKKYTGYFSQQPSSLTYLVLLSLVLSCLFRPSVAQPHHNNNHQAGCTFDLRSIQNIEQWWNGNMGDLDAQTINCITKGVGRTAGTIAGAYGGSKLGAWLGGTLGDMLGFKADGERIGRMIGFKYGYQAGGDIGAALNLYALLGGGDGGKDEGDGKYEDGDDGGTGYQKHKTFSHADSKRKTLMKCYAMMDLSSTSEKRDIKTAYRKNAVAAHPDKHGGKHDAMVQLNLCYEIVLLANTGSSSRGGGKSRAGL